MLSPLDCQVHLLEPEQPGDLLKARCGHTMPLGPAPRAIRARDPLCVACATVAEPPRSHEFPAGRRSSAASTAPSAPGGQPGSNDLNRVAEVLRNAGSVESPRWVQCLISDQQHVLTPHGVAMAAADGYARAACGRRMASDRISDTLTGRPCMGCLAVTAGTVPPPPQPLTRARIVAKLRTLLPAIGDNDE